MEKLIVYENKCPANHSCPSVKVCPVGALIQNGYAAPSVDHDKCIKCGMCVKRCPKGALIIEDAPTILA